MTRRTRAKKIDFVKLEKICAKRGLSFKRMSLDIGFSESYITMAKSRGIIAIPALKLICQCLGVEEDYFDINEEKDVNDDYNIAYALVLEKIKNLENRIEKMENNKRVELSDRENIILLLKNMTRYGQCEDLLFRQKAKAEGFQEEIIQFALSQCTKELINGKVWIKARKK